MGNRAVITTREQFDNNGIGVYVHWNGGRDSVEAFLAYCKDKGYRSLTDDPSFGFARLCQVIGNYFGGDSSVGVDRLDRLDCDNGDNGVYIVKGWEIVGREYFDWSEQHEYPLEDMMNDIDDQQPEREKIRNHIVEE